VLSVHHTHIGIRSASVKLQVCVLCASDPGSTVMRVDITWLVEYLLVRIYDFDGKPYYSYEVQSENPYGLQ
jgi:hypothetical protein